MKKFLKIALSFVALSLLMVIFWIVGMAIGNAIFPSDLMETASDESSAGAIAWMLLVCMLNTGVILAFVLYSRVRGWQLIVRLFLIVFGIQFFMAQIETLWFNDALNMPLNSIAALVTGGTILSFAMSFFSVWFTGGFRSIDVKKSPGKMVLTKPLVLRILLLAVVIWPAVYFLAGYFIAWQFADIRQYYSGSAGMDGFFVMMQENIRSGLYLFQVIRGFLWVSIALLVLRSMGEALPLRAVVLGLLLSVLGGSQLLLPNPIMPEMVRTGHFIEVSVSNFIWGLLLAWFLCKFLVKAPAIHRDETIPINQITA